MAPIASFDEFYVGTRASVLRQLTAMTTDPELAADVVQEAYSRARWRGDWRVSQHRRQQFQGPNSTPDPVSILFQDFTHVEDRVPQRLVTRGNRSRAG
jgi:hypothetical protein